MKFLLAYIVFLPWTLLDRAKARRRSQKALAATLPLLQAAGYKVEVVPQGVAYVRDTNLIPFRQRALGDRIGDREAAV